MLVLWTESALRVEQQLPPSSLNTVMSTGTRSVVPSPVRSTMVSASLPASSETREFKSQISLACAVVVSCSSFAVPSQ